MPRGTLASAGAVLVAAYGVLFLGVIVPWTNEQARTPPPVIALHLVMFVVAVAVLLVVVRDIVRDPALGDWARAMWLVLVLAALPLAVPAFYLRSAR